MPSDNSCLIALADGRFHEGTPDAVNAIVLPMGSEPAAVLLPCIETQFCELDNAGRATGVAPWQPGEQALWVKYGWYRVRPAGGRIWRWISALSKDLQRCGVHGGLTFSRFRKANSARMREFSPNGPSSL